MTATAQLPVKTQHREHEQPAAPRKSIHDPRHWLRRWFPTSRRLLLERGLRALSLLHHQSVLVVGAGHDPYHDLFPHSDDYIRLDIEMVPGITDVVASALDLPFGDCRFDCVIATECFEHISDPFLFCRELTRVLRPGGQIVLTVPFLFHQHGDPYDFWRPTRHCLMDLFKDFSSVQIQSLGNRLHVISDLVTTAGFKGMLVPLRLVNHLLVRLPGAATTGPGGTTAPTGFLLTANK